jgi:hypothetical protein
MNDQIKAAGVAVVSVATFALTLWWLVLVAQRLGVKAEVDASGNVTLDTFQRAKDILLVVLPLFSAALAFWVGNSGTAEAKKQEKVAKEQLNAVVDTSPEGILEKAKQKHPDAWAK